MKHIFFLTAVLFYGMTAVSQPLDRSVVPKPGPAPTVSLGTTDTFTLQNGLKVFVVENHKLPAIQCNLELDIKPALEGDMAGYKDMMSELLLSGTKTRTKDKINEEIDFMGVHFSVSDKGMSAQGLKKYAGKIFELMADVAMNAVIKPDELERTKEKVLSELETEKNDPDAMVNNVSAVVNFGHNHPYGEVPTEETIKKISLERCNQYYHTYFRPNVAYLAIVGDVTMKEVKPLIEKYFGKWQKKEVPVAVYEVAGLKGERPSQVEFINNPSAVQSVINITYPVDLQPGDPDVLHAQLVNSILGGGSQGRLFLIIREKHAWSYGAYSSLTADMNGGTFTVSVKCRNQVTDSVIDAVLEEMRFLQRTRLKETDFRNSINYLSGNFAIGLENPAVVAQYAINTVRYRLPEDYYKNYLKNLQEEESGAIQEKSGQYLLPDNVNIVVAGNMDEVADKLRRFSASGKISYYDAYGRSADETGIKPAPDGLTADQVVKKYIAAIGGEGAITRIKDIKIVGTSTIKGTQITVTEMKKAPDKWEKEVDVLENGSKVRSQQMYYNGEVGYEMISGQKIVFGGDDLTELAEQSDMYAVFHPAKYNIKRSLKGVEPLDGTHVYVVEATYGTARKAMEYYDTASGLLVKVIRGRVGSSQISIYSDYREVPGGGGYKIPYSITEKSQGQAITEQVQTVEVNKGITDGVFD